MSQTKWQSLRETLTNTVVGMAGSWLITMGTLQIVDTKMAIATVTTIGCTVWSISRGYAIRRYFNAKTN